MRQIVCDSCFNKEICMYVGKANELFQELEKIVDKYDLGDNAPIAFGLSVTCPKFTRGGSTPRPPAYGGMR